MTVAGLTVSANATANNIAVTSVLKSGTQPHGNTVTVSRAGSQTTGDTTSTAYTITTQNSIGGITANVTQQTGYSSTLNGSDSLISYASVAGQGVDFHAASPDNAAHTATAGTPAHSTIAATNTAPAADNTNSPASVAAASTNAPQALQPAAPANIQPQSANTQAVAAAAPSNANPPAAPPIASGLSGNSAPAQTNAEANTPSPPPASNAGSTQDTGSGGYTALANAGASTIRGGTLNVVA